MLKKNDAIDLLRRMATTPIYSQNMQQAFTLGADALEQLPDDADGEFAAIRDAVMLGSRRICTAASANLAKRISNALNLYRPNRRGR